MTRLQRLGAVICAGAITLGAGAQAQTAAIPHLECAGRYLALAEAFRVNRLDISNYYLAKAEASLAAQVAIDGETVRRDHIETSRSAAYAWAVAIAETGEFTFRDLAAAAAGCDRQYGYDTLDVSDATGG